MKVFVFCLLIMSLSASTPAQHDAAPGSEKIIEAVNSRFCKIAEEKNYQNLRGFYSDDCWIMLPNSRILCGPEAVSDYALYLKKHVALQSVRMITIDVFGDEKDTLTEVGFYHWLGSNGKPFDDGKYIIVWKKEGGVWKRHREIFSSSHATEKIN